MLNRKSILFLVLIFSNLFFTDITVFAGFLKSVSNLNFCTYDIDWYKSNWSQVKVLWVPVNCNWNINMVNLWYDDWIYKVYFNSSDNTINPWANSMTSINKWIYRVDTKPVECRFVSLTINWIENQYYNNWNLYYKSGPGAGWSFDLEIECKDTSLIPTPICFWEKCISWIEELNWPTILWTTPTRELYPQSLANINKTVTYSWNGNYLDSFDILQHATTNLVKDSAWNWSNFPASPNITVYINDNNWNLLNTINNVSSLNLIPDRVGPTIWNTKYRSWNNWSLAYKPLTILSYFSALDNRQIDLWSLTDTLTWSLSWLWSWLRWYNLYIENEYNTWSTKYQKDISNLITRKTSLLTSVFSHNFKYVSMYDNGYINWYRPYSWEVNSIDSAWKESTKSEICDMVGNCTNVQNPAFKVVANVPHWPNSLSASLFKATYSWIVSDNYDTYDLTISFKDKYNNEIVPVTNVKELVITNNFDNTLWRNQLTNPTLWDWVEFAFTDINAVSIWNINSNNNRFEETFTNPSNLLKWTYNLVISSVVPTYNEYKTNSNNPWEKGKSMYWNSLLPKLEFNTFKIDVNKKNWHDWVWEFSSTNNFLWILPEFKFNPIISFDYIDNIFPLVEWQVKRMDIKNNIKNGNLISYKLNIFSSINNAFLKITESYLDWQTKTFWDISDNVIRHIIWSPSWDWIISKATGINGDVFNILPQTLGWIIDNNTKIALYTNLEYVVDWKTVNLPWIQTWFNTFWVHNISHFTNNNLYWTVSNVIFSEIEISWITQTNNTLWHSTWSWAITTSNSTFNDFSKITLLDLKTNVHKNLINILKWSNKSDWDISNDITLNQADLDNFGTFNKWLSLQWWNVLYINWNNNYDVELDCWTDLNWKKKPCRISWKKTIIIENANLIIDSDMYYDSNNINSILWIVLIWNDDNWNSSQLRINENITNWVWIVYAEGPVVSVNSSGVKYDWNNIWDKLINQLHWKWSFITKNTVWWSITNINSRTSCPYGTPEYEDNINCTQKIAQWYDLIYLRRYARVDEAYYSATSPMWDTKVPLHYDTKDVKIAWWITITSSWSMDTWNSNLISDNQNYNSPFILDYDSKIQSNPPYVFE